MAQVCEGPDEPIERELKAGAGVHQRGVESTSKSIHEVA